MRLVVMSKRKTIPKLLEEFKSVHGDKYDYSLITEYQNRKTKLPIICHCKDDEGNEHGIFYQTACSHFFNKQGCPKCAKNGVKYTTDEFIKKVSKIWPELLFNKVEYINAHTKIIVTCPQHGDFEIQPYLLLQNHGCKFCAFEKRNKMALIGTDEFIRRSKEIHGDNIYDYSKVEYTGNDSEVCIICPEHGEFYQRASIHMYQGCGCPKCKTSRLEREIMNKFPNFEREKKFDWLRYEYPLRLDFFIPNKNIAIECQGIQHFIQIWYKGSKEDEYHTLKKTQMRDELKYKLCKEHGVEVVYYFTENLLEYNKDFYKDKIYFFTIDELNNFLNNV